MRYVSHLACSTCGATYPADRPMNLCPVDDRPVQMVLDLDRVKAERGPDRFWSPDRPNLWRFGGLLPLDWDDPGERRSIVSLGEGHTPCLPYDHPVARAVGCHLEVKDEGRPHRDHGGNPTLSFKDRGMAMTVSMARALGLARLAVPTQGNAGDSLATYAVAAGLEVIVAMSPDTDRPVLGNVAALAKLHPENVRLELVSGTIVDCAARIREHYLPQGYFSVATFQEPGWRTEGKKTLGLEMAEPSGDRLASRTWKLPDVIIYPTGGGTGVVGMAKAFDELEALGLVGPERPRMICVQSVATAPDCQGLRVGLSRHCPPAPRPDDRDGSERRAERWAHQRAQDHPRDRRRSNRRDGRGDPRDDPRRVARPAVRLVARGGRDSGGIADACGLEVNPPRRPRRAREHGVAREVSADDPRPFRRGSLSPSPANVLPGEADLDKTRLILARAFALADAIVPSPGESKARPPMSTAALVHEVGPSKLRPASLAPRSESGSSSPA